MLFIERQNVLFMLVYQCLCQGTCNEASCVVIDLQLARRNEQSIVKKWMIGNADLLT